MLEDAIRFVLKNMRIRTVVDENGHRTDKREYPVAAVREAIINALIHRDYSTLTESSPVCVEMYRDRIEVISNGNLRSVDWTGMPAKHPAEKRPEPRNTALADILQLLEVTRNQGTGIPAIFASVREAGLPDPEFEIDGDLLRVRIRNVWKNHET